MMFSLRQPLEAHAQPELAARLKWLEASTAQEEQRHQLFRTAQEEQEMLLMRRPIPTQRAYALFGLLLGLLPPVAIFYRLSPIFRYADDLLVWVAFCVAMNLICAVVGRMMGAQLGKRIDKLERASWIKMWGVSVLLGVAWGFVTGAAGGLIFFGIGALFGAACASVVGALGFLIFTTLHRLLARGGMIDARHFWPLAWGVTLVLVALLLSPHVFY